MPKSPTAPASAPMSVDAVADLCWAVGGRGEGLEDALAVCLGENGGSPDASASNVNTGPNIAAGYEGSVDRGLFNINNRAHTDVTDAIAYDPASNVAAAYRISAGFTKFGAWSTWPTIANRYRTEARAAAKRREQLGGSGSLAGIGSATSTPTSGTVTTGATSVDMALPPTPLPVGYIAPQRPSGMEVHALGGAKRQDLDELIVDGDVELTTDRTSQITVRLLSAIERRVGLPRVVVGSRFTWGTFGRIAPMRVAVWEHDPADGTNEVTITVRPDAIHRLRTPSGNPDTSAAPTRANVSATEYADEVASNVGLRFHGQGSPRLPEISPARIDPSGAQFTKRLETPWEVLDRLATDNGFLLFAVDDVLCFGSIEWLAARATEIRVGWASGWGNRELDCAVRPTYRFSEDNPRLEQICTFELPRWRGELVRPGMRVAFRGIIGLERDKGWFVTKVSWPIDYGFGNVSVECVHPVNPVLKPAETPSPSTGLPANVVPTGTKSALDFVTLALAQQGDHYVWGANADINDQDPDQFDCSELVRWAAGRCGVDIAGYTVAQYRAVQQAGLTRSVDSALHVRGALVFRFSSDPLTTTPSARHVAISLGDDERVIEAAGKDKGVVIGNAQGRGWTHAGLVPGLDYGRPLQRVGQAA